MNIPNGDILYLYDAKLTNPNGDPDEENRPRMDEATGRNLVSDVRLKRYLRDYWLNLGKCIWVRKTEKGRTTDAKGRMKTLLEKYNAECGTNLKDKDARGDSGFEGWILDSLMDVRLFGATMPMEGSSLTFTGPVQFGWGYSLHRVEVNSSATISSTFSGRNNEYGTFGKDWRVYYSLIGFHGITSRNRAPHTNLTEDDLRELDSAMISAIPQEATSRSKIGQTPRLYMRVEYKEDARLQLGDLREYVKPIPVEGKTLDTLRDIRDYSLDISAMVEKVELMESNVDRAYLHAHPELESPVENELRRVLGERLSIL
jgi:CRISPR-associated protein Csh2